MKNAKIAKNAEAPNKPEASKQKKQLIILGSLVGVLGMVLAVQFGGSEPEPPVAAATASPVAGAESQPVAAGGAAPVAAAPAAPEPVATAEDNAVLSQPVEGAFSRSPFANFWSNATASAPSSSQADVPAPVMTLSATMPADSHGLAVIDGQLHFLGDSIQGWQLTEIRPRAVVLRSPADATIVVEMPVLVGKLDLPAGQDG